MIILILITIALLSIAVLYGASIRKLNRENIDSLRPKQVYVDEIIDEAISEQAKQDLRQKTPPHDIGIGVKCANPEMFFKWDTTWEELLDGIPEKLNIRKFNFKIELCPIVWKEGLNRFDKIEIEYLEKAGIGKITILAYESGCDPRQGKFESYNQANETLENLYGLSLGKNQDHRWYFAGINMHHYLWTPPWSEFQVDVISIANCKNQIQQVTRLNEKIGIHQNKLRNKSA